MADDDSKLIAATTGLMFVCIGLALIAYGTDGKIFENSHHHHHCCGSFWCWH